MRPEVAAVAAAKAAGLRRHYGTDGPGVAFWMCTRTRKRATPTGRPVALAATAASPAQVTSAELVISTARNQERPPGAWRASTCDNKCVHRARYRYGPDLFPDY